MEAHTRKHIKNHPQTHTRHVKSILSLFACLLQAQGILQRLIILLNLSLLCPNNSLSCLYAHSWKFTLQGCAMKMQAHERHAITQLSSGWPWKTNSRTSGCAFAVQMTCISALIVSCSNLMIKEPIPLIYRSCIPRGQPRICTTNTCSYLLCFSHTHNPRGLCSVPQLPAGAVSVSEFHWGQRSCSAQVGRPLETLLAAENHTEASKSTKCCLLEKD